MAESNAPLDGEVVGDGDDHTVMVDRVVEPADSAEDGDDHTVVVDRVVEPADNAEDGDDHTLVVDRVVEPADSAEDGDDHTVVVGRAAGAKGGAEPEDDAGDHTFVVKRKRAPGDGNDHTVVVDRKDKTPTLNKSEPTGRRRGIAKPPVPEGFAPKPVEAIGPGAVEEYIPRAIPEPPALHETPEQGPEATRAPAPAMPSVKRRTQRGARVTLGLFVGACVGAVVGLVAIIVALQSL